MKKMIILLSAFILCFFSYSQDKVVKERKSYTGDVIFIENEAKLPAIVDAIYFYDDSVEYYIAAICYNGVWEKEQNIKCSHINTILVWSSDEELKKTLYRLINRYKCKYTFEYKKRRFVF